jgi:hypothetical protein
MRKHVPVTIMATSITGIKMKNRHYLPVSPSKSVRYRNGDAFESLNTAKMSSPAGSAVDPN